MLFFEVLRAVVIAPPAPGGAAGADPVGILHPTCWCEIGGQGGRQHVGQATRAGHDDAPGRVANGAQLSVYTVQPSRFGGAGLVDPVAIADLNQVAAEVLAIGGTFVE